MTRSAAARSAFDSGKDPGSEKVDPKRCQELSGTFLGVLRTLSRPAARVERDFEAQSLGDAIDPGLVANGLPRTHVLGRVPHPYLVAIL
jgi:hypothetical protein